MTCEPVRVRCGCGALLDCQHDPEAEAAFPFVPQYEALARDVAAAIADLEQREAAITELGGRFLGEALTIRKQYLERSITWCPGCGEAVRVEFLIRRPMIVLAELEGGRLHWCPAMPIAPNVLERIRSHERTEPKAAPANQTLCVEVPRVG